MELLPAEKIMEQIARRYNKNPRGWQVFVGKGVRGYQNLFFVQNKGVNTRVWQIKQHYLNPYKIVGLGAMMERNQLGLLRNPEFGLRPVPQTELAELLDEKISLKILSDILSRSPVATSEAIRSEGILSGPVIHLSKTSGFLSKEQEELDLRLRSELEKLLWKHYPERMRLSV